MCPEPEFRRATIGFPAREMPFETQSAFFAGAVLCSFRLVRPLPARRFRFSYQSDLNAFDTAD